MKLNSIQLSRSVTKFENLLSKCLDMTQDKESKLKILKINFMMLLEKLRCFKKLWQTWI